LLEQKLVAEIRRADNGSVWTDWLGKTIADFVGEELYALPVAAPSRTDLSRMALTWYDTQQSEDGLNRDEFHLFVLELIDTLTTPVAAPAQAKLLGCPRCGEGSSAHTSEGSCTASAEQMERHRKAIAAPAQAEQILTELKEKS
jgi:hypothetical protein